MTDSKTSDSQSWRWLSVSFVLVFAAAVITIGLISTGIFDPKPIGAPAGTLPLDPVSLEDNEQRLTWLVQPAPAGDHSLRLTAALAGGEVDSAYGLVVGGGTEYIVVAISPVGTVTMWLNDGSQQQNIIPWRTWPHVIQEEGANELWLDVQDGALRTVRTNRELLWSGTQDVPGRGIGLWAQSFGGPAEIDFKSLETFAAKNSD